MDERSPSQGRYERRSWTTLHWSRWAMKASKDWNCPSQRSSVTVPGLAGTLLIRSNRILLGSFFGRAYGRLKVLCPVGVEGVLSADSPVLTKVSSSFSVGHTWFANYNSSHLVRGVLRCCHIFLCPLYSSLLLVSRWCGGALVRFYLLVGDVIIEDWRAEALHRSSHLAARRKLELHIHIILSGY